MKKFFGYEYNFAYLEWSAIKHPVYSVLAGLDLKRIYD